MYVRICNNYMDWSLAYVTSAFMPGGDLAYASSYAVTLQKHSLRAPREILGICHQMLILATASQVVANFPQGES